MNNVSPCIAVIQKWNKDIHGISWYEKKYTSYLSTKYLLCWDIHYYYSDTDEEEDTTTRYLNVHSLNEALSFVGTLGLGNEIPCIIKKTYVYKDRTFCIRNYGIELFQKLWRDFHYIKMARYKAIKNLQYRQIYGKYRIKHW